MSFEPNSQAFVVWAARGARGEEQPSASLGLLQPGWRIEAWGTLLGKLWLTARADAGSCLLYIKFMVPFPFALIAVSRAAAEDALKRIAGHGNAVRGGSDQHGDHQTRLRAPHPRQVFPPLSRLAAEDGTGGQRRAALGTQIHPPKDIPSAKATTPGSSLHRQEASASILKPLFFSFFPPPSSKPGIASASPGA